MAQKDEIKYPAHNAPNTALYFWQDFVYSLQCLILEFNKLILEVKM